MNEMLLQHLLVGQGGELAVVEPENRTVVADNANEQLVRIGNRGWNRCNRRGTKSYFDLVGISKVR